MSMQPRSLIGGATALLLVLALAAGGPSCSKKDPEDSGQPAAVTTSQGIPMVSIPAGRFVMGSAAGGETDEAPHPVSISAFLMDQHPVTQEDYESAMGQNPSRWKNPKAPVDQIRWTDAARYCNTRSRAEGLPPAYDETTWQCDFASAGYRLPTEAEWEYACRAGSTTAYCFGDNPSELVQYGWFKDSAVRAPQPVASRRPNAWGLYDMHGNVWEWCHDFYGEEYYKSSPEKDPTGPAKTDTRVLRGGCWNSPAAKCRSDYRYYENPGYTDACFGRDISGFVGFRCVRRAPATE
jgi:formylglycine-generating enzyme required for sulfatase activity